jgi:hypothetical protein
LQQTRKRTRHLRPRLLITAPIAHYEHLTAPTLDSRTGGVLA